MSTLAPSAAGTARFTARREQILDVGSRLINERGLKGLSLGAVAEEIGLGGSSVTYYFRRKELLAAACFERALDALAGQVAAAGGEADPVARIGRLLALSGRQETGRVLAQLHELRATAEPHRTELIRSYFAIYRGVRQLFGPAAGNEQRLLQVMRAQVLLEVAHALPVWLDRYAPEEHARVVDRLLTLLVDGLAPAGAAPPVPAAPPAPEEGEARARFLDAATRLINERGYRGTSVDRIAAELKVTKGSFYHHLDAKDELVLACLDRSLSAIGRAQNEALAAADGSCLDRLAVALGNLISIQFGSGTPLLRSTALAVLPPELRRDAVDRSERAALRFSGMVIDGISDGSVRAVDPLIAGHVVTAALNAAYELRDLSARAPDGRAVAMYASTLLHGLIG